MSTEAIKYVGKKEQKADSVAGTGIVWNGSGDVQDVPAGAVGKLLAHPDCWERADPVSNASRKPSKAGKAGKDESDTSKDPEPGNMESEKSAGNNEMSEADAKPPMANISTMGKEDLRQFAQQHFNHAFHHKVGESSMRQTIIGLMNKG